MTEAYVAAWLGDPSWEIVFDMALGSLVLGFVAGYWFMRRSVDVIRGR